MSPGYDDDDDWVGTPPEGRRTHDESHPEAWRKPFRAQTIVYGLIGLGIVAVVILALVAS